MSVKEPVDRTRPTHFCCRLNRPQPQYLGICLSSLCVAGILTLPAYANREEMEPNMMTAKTLGFHYVYSIFHRVGRVISFFASHPNRDSPNPSPAGECAPPPLLPGGRATLAGDRGGGRVPIPTRGHTLWYSTYICTLLYIPVRHVTGNDQDYLRKIPRVVVQKSALL